MTDGETLTDALGKFLELKMERLKKGANDDDYSNVERYGVQSVRL